MDWAINIFGENKTLLVLLYGIRYYHNIIIMLF
jgi:hypothetical protein